MDNLKKEIEKLFTLGLSEKTVTLMVKDIYRELKNKPAEIKDVKETKAKGK